MNGKKVCSEAMRALIKAALEGAPPSFRSAGSAQGTHLRLTHTHGACGGIEDGVGFDFHGRDKGNCGFVIALEDLKRIVAIAESAREEKRAYYFQTLTRVQKGKPDEKLPPHYRQYKENW